MVKNRMRLLWFFLLLASYQLTCQANTLRPTRLTDNVYLLDANVGVVVGEEEVLLIDTWLGYFNEKAHQTMLQQVKSITGKPIKYAINTHSHGDHSGGNKFLVEQGVTVIKHHNSIYSPYFPKSGRAKPAIHFKEQFQLDLGNEQVTAQHLVAHTFDDAFVLLERQNVLFVGDNLVTKFWVGLGIFGLDSFHLWSEKALQIMDEETLLIPGHGKTYLNKRQLLQYKQDVIDWVAYMQKLYDKGFDSERMSQDLKAQELYAKLILDKGQKKELLAREVNKLIREELSKPIPLTPKQLQQYVGSFDYPELNRIQIEIFQGKLVAKQKDKFYTYLKPITQEKFVMVNLNRDDQLHFSFDKAGNVTGFTPVLAQDTHYKSLQTGLWTRAH